MTRGYIALAWLVSALTVQAALLEKVISLEDPRFNPERTRLTVGLDGRVYLTGRPGTGGSLVLSMLPDGSERRDIDAGYALNTATANRDGIIATANEHFSHSINYYDQDGNLLRANSEFTTGHKYGFKAPGYVAAAPSGAFYALDQHVHRIVRLDELGRITEVYSLPEDVEFAEMRVAEEAEQFYLRDSWKGLYVFGFNGELKWRHGLSSKAFTVNEKGDVFILHPHDAILEVIASPDPAAGEGNGEALKSGKPKVERVRLEMGEWSPSQEYPAIGLDLHDGRFFIKRSHPTEMFLTVDAETLKWVDRVRINSQRLAAEFPDGAWVAGTRVPFSVSYDRDASISTEPEWRLWMTTFGDDDWRELTWDGETAQIPSDATGLQHIRVVASMDPSSDPEQRLDGVVQVYAPNHEGTVSVWTPNNRVGFHRGETVPLTLSLRSSRLSAVDVDVRLVGPNDLDESIATATVDAGTNVTVEIPADRTKRLTAGRYRIVPQAQGVTGVVQPLRFGPFEGEKPRFRTSVGADYLNNISYAADAWNFADEAERLRARSEVMGYNQFFNRNFAGRTGYPLSFHGSGKALLRTLQTELESDADGIDPAKAEFGFAHLHALGLYGGLGTREWIIPIRMDAWLPLGTGFDKRSPEEMKSQVRTYASALQGLPAFEGFCWNQNWWTGGWGRAGWFSSPEQMKTYKAAYAHAMETGEWASILEEVGEGHIQQPVIAQDLLAGAFREVDQQRKTAAAGPYRRPEIYAPTNFSNVDEVSLHFQHEQITIPNWTAHAPDYYKVAGKPIWMHPELYNDDGTGELTLSLSWLGVMRGVGGTGMNGLFYEPVRPEVDPRSGYHGIHSVMRAMNAWLGDYGPWLTRLENQDRVAIAVSERQIMMDGHLTFVRYFATPYFRRLFEAYQTFLHTDYPATFVYAEDLDQGALDGIDALVVVSQEVEPGPKLQRILDEAEQRNIPIFYDGNSRSAFFENAQPLNLSFDRLDVFKKTMNNDLIWWQFPEIFVEQASELNVILESRMTPAAVRKTGHPEVLVSERASGDVRSIWVVNNAHVPIEPGLLWRVTPATTTRLPVPFAVEIELNPGEVLYEVFDQRLVRSIGDAGSSAEPITETITGILKGGEARLFVVLPAEVGAPDLEVEGQLAPGNTVHWRAEIKGIEGLVPLRVELRDGEGELIQARSTTTGPGSITVPDNVALPVSLAVRELITGQQIVLPEKAVTKEREPCVLNGARLRDVAVSNNGRTALVNGMGWGANAFLVDLETGRIKQQLKIGDYHAYAPLAVGDEFLIQGYDLKSAEGYYSYHLDSEGRIDRRLAHPGMPLRRTPWAFPFNLSPPRNGHTAATDGSWSVTAGNIGLAVWDDAGELMWSLGGVDEDRKMMRIAAMGNQLVVADGIRIDAYDVSGRKAAEAPEPAWTVTLPTPEPVLGLVVDPETDRVAVWTKLRGGRVYIFEDAVLKTTIPVAVGAVALDPVEGRIAVAEGERLHVFGSDGGLLWTARDVSTLYFPEFSPDGEQIAVATAYGKLCIYRSDDGAEDVSVDMAGIPRPVWLEDGDLLTVGWMGAITRLSVDGSVRWQTTVFPELKGVPDEAGVLAAESVPTSRWTPWEETLAEPKGTPLLSIGKVKASLGPFEPAEKRLKLKHPVRRLFDGDLTPPESPWVDWETLLMADSGWSGSYYLTLDTSPRRVRLESIRFVEDPEQPQSWLRDMKLEVWNPEMERWEFAGFLTSDAADHTHLLPAPVEGSRFRVSAADDALQGWPQSNLRLAEIQFYGEELKAGKLPSPCE